MRDIPKPAQIASSGNACFIAAMDSVSAPAPRRTRSDTTTGANLDSFSWPAKQASIRDDTSKSCQVNPGLRHQGAKPSHEIQWLEYHVGCAIPKTFAAAKVFASLMGQDFSIRSLKLVADVAV